MKATIFSSKQYEKEYFHAANIQHQHELRFIESALSVETISAAQGTQAIIAFVTDTVSAKILELMHKLNIHYVATRSAGYDHIDIQRANQLGIRVANVPDYSPYAIAEHAIMLMLALNRKLLLGQRKMYDGNFSLEHLTGFDMHGKTVGIIGTGKIGLTSAKILHGFGCNILGYDLNPNPNAAQYAVHYTNLETLCQKADIITLHIPLTAATQGLINRTLITQMKPGVMLINTSRGRVVDTQAVIDSLKSGHISAFGADVYENEKDLFFVDHSGEILQDDLFARIKSFSNVIITGHQAFLTDVALKNIAQTTLLNLEHWQIGKTCANELTSLK